MQIKLYYMVYAYQCPGLKCFISFDFFFIFFLLAAEASIKETTSRPHGIQMRHAGSMQPMYRRDAGVWHQTRSLLYKNLLIKWRTKQQSLQVLSFQKTDMSIRGGG